MYVEWIFCLEWIYSPRYNSRSTKVCCNLELQLSLGVEIGASENLKNQFMCYFWIKVETPIPAPIPINGP